MLPHSIKYTLSVPYNSFSHFIKMSMVWHLSTGMLLKKNALFVVFALLMAAGSGYAQTKAIDKKEFFRDDQLIEMTIVADFKKLIREKLKKDYRRNIIPATITC